MAPTHARRTRAGLVSLALVAALAGCGAGEGDGEDTAAPSPSGTQGRDGSPAPSPTPTDEEEPSDDAPDDATDAPVPDGLPDPQDLVGAQVHDEQAEDGTWHTVVDGEPLEPVNIFGSCFAGGTDDVCAYSISGHGRMGEDGVPAPSDAALLLLLRSTGGTDDVPTWEVLDAVVARAPEPAVLQTCEGEDGVAIYPAADLEELEASGSDEVPVAAAWGPDDAIEELVEVDPATVTCEYQIGWG